MPLDSPLQKRIKRHVIGRKRAFFIAVPPGFESLCLKELAAPPLSIEGTAVPGGIDFEGRLDDCWRANLHLRIANRILMRIASFKATDFARLQQKASDIPWELYLPPKPAPLVHVTTARSRLYHTGAIAERVLGCIQSRLEKWAPKSGRFPSEHDGIQRIFVRAESDQFTLSIDSSGPLLYQRGVKTHGGRAPIRETIAAAALTLAGYTGQEPLLDPMCGSGTFAIEGAMMAAGIPPGAFRTFAFMGWPSFIPRKWAYIRRNAENAKPASSPVGIFASDIDPASCRSLAQCVESCPFSGMIDVSCRDFFALSPGELSGRKGVVALNPPYGRRLGSRQESRSLFQTICTHLLRTYPGWKIALVAPEPEWVTDVPFPLARLSFRHGGLQPVLLTGIVP